jgi:hypothetical protein
MEKVHRVMQTAFKDIGHAFEFDVAADFSIVPMGISRTKQDLVQKTNIKFV